MKVICPHCQAKIETDPETHASLVGHSHFACPMCQGAVSVPPGASPSLEFNPVPRAQTAMADHQAKRPSKSTSASNKRNRNLLILGSAALLVLGGLAFFLASRSGSIFNTEHKITNEIIHNSYFQNLITSGGTTKSELEAMASIRPHGDGFIGISKEALSWKQAVEMAGKTGSQVLNVDEVADESREQVLEWLESNFRSHLSSPVWVGEHDAARVLDGPDVLAVTALDRTRKAFFHWTVGEDSANDPNHPTRWKKAVDLLSLVSLPEDVVSGQWVRGDGTLTSDLNSIAKIQIPYQPPPEYDFRMVFTCAAGSGQAGQLLSHGGKSFGFIVGARQGTVMGIDSIDGKGVGDNPTCSRVATELGRKYTSIVQVRKDGIKAFLDNKLVAEWRTDYSDMSIKEHWALRDGRHLGFGTFGTSVTFHSLEILPVSDPRTGDETDFVPLFNGRDLTGWNGDPRFWSVRSGAIIAESPRHGKVPKNTFLIWQGGAVGNFELRLSYQIIAGNSGVQYRSKANPTAWSVLGYQYEIEAGSNLLANNGALFEEGGSRKALSRPGGEFLANPGQKVQWSQEGARKVVGNLGGNAHFRSGDWNDLAIICKGNRLIHKLNGITTIDMIDDDSDSKATSGVLALQLHGGSNQKVMFKDIRIKQTDSP